MELTPEIIGAAVAIGYGIVRVLEYGAKTIYAMTTGKKDSMSEMSDLLAKATNNHLAHLQNGTDKLVELTEKSIEQHNLMIDQGKQQIATHEKQIELLGIISGKLSK